jgi:hypothetical protein
MKTSLRSRGVSSSVEALYVVNRFNVKVAELKPNCFGKFRRCHRLSDGLAGDIAEFD